MAPEELGCEYGAVSVCFSSFKRRERENKAEQRQRSEMGLGRVCALVVVSPFFSLWGSGSFHTSHQLDKPVYSFHDDLS